MPPKPPKLRYRLPTAIMVPVLIAALLIESAQMFLFFAFVGIAAQAYDKAKEIGNYAETAIDVVEGAFLALGALSVGLCLVTAGAGCVGVVVVNIARRVAFWVLKEQLKKQLKAYAKKLFRGVLQVLSFLASSLTWLLLLAFYMLAAIFLTLRGISPWELLRRNPAATAAMIAIETLPYAGTLIPSITLWLWRVWRRTRKEDEERYQKALAQWEAQMLAYQAQQRRLLEQQLLLAQLARWQQATQANTAVQGGAQGGGMRPAVAV